MDCKAGNQRIIRQLLNVIESLDDRKYSSPLKIYNGSSIGQHIRHIYDFYNCFFNGIAKGRIDYARRERNPHIERNPEYAQEAFHRLFEDLLRLSNKSLLVIADFSGEEDQDRRTVHSSIDRELMFLHDHAVHHLAIVKIGIQSAFPEIVLEEELGVAPATIRYQRDSP